MVNGRLAEIFFDREDDEIEPKMMGHCYVSADEYKTRQEKNWIEKDTKRNQFSYRNKVYRDKIGNKVLENAPRDVGGSTKGIPIDELIALLKQRDA